VPRTGFSCPRGKISRRQICAISSRRKSDAPRPLAAAHQVLPASGSPAILAGLDVRHPQLRTFSSSYELIAESYAPERMMKGKYQNSRGIYDSSSALLAHLRM
jgi:hypothetical protein